MLNWPFCKGELSEEIYMNTPNGMNKESEKIPTEITASLKTLLDDTLTIYKTKDSQTALDFIEFQKNFVKSMVDWFYKIETTSAMLEKISSMNTFFAKFDSEGLQVPYIIKMKNEQNAIN